MRYHSFGKKDEADFFWNIKAETLDHISGRFFIEQLKYDSDGNFNDMCERPARLKRKEKC